MAALVFAIALTIIFGNAFPALADTCEDVAAGTSFSCSCGSVVPTGTGKYAALCRNTSNGSAVPYTCIGDSPTGPWRCSPGPPPPPDPVLCQPGWYPEERTGVCLPVPVQPPTSCVANPLYCVPTIVPTSLRVRVITPIVVSDTKAYVSLVDPASTQVEPRLHSSGEDPSELAVVIDGREDPIYCEAGEVILDGVDLRLSLSLAEGVVVTYKVGAFDPRAISHCP